MPSYNPRAIEPRWQRFWLDNRIFRTPDDSPKPKLYVLDMFPYPSGSGLHVGHPEGYTATDILCRYQRMRGKNVLHPMGWDAFGLPAEQHAIATGEHPHANTQRNINNFRRQIQALGFSYDWGREVDTTDPNYYRWTQWIFLVLFDTWYDAEQKKGRPIAELPIPSGVTGEEEIRKYRDGKRLAYQAEVPVNWCAALGTVLANEEVIDGKSERGGHPVVRMPLRQWLLRITAYADRLLDDLEGLDWTDSIKKMQQEWIGRSEGAEVDFPISHSRPIRIYTTRPDTLFGATYMVLSPEHPLVPVITTPEQRAAVEAYQQAAARKSEFERTQVAKTKTGVFTGATATNPVNGEQIPIWIADYVLASYGTGAIMAVPAHDERDFAFATAFGLPIRTVVTPSAEWLKKTGSTVDELTGAYTDDGAACNSGEFDGLDTPTFKARIIERLEAKGQGTRKVNYKLRDWLFSRQRYWGEPFPILHEIDAEGKPTGRIEALSPDELPLRLPEVVDYKPTGRPEPPLEKAGDWLFVERDGRRYKRETNTMPQWAGSCWYYLRYIDPNNDKAFAAPEKVRHWLPVDLYVGGAEHAVLHLLYSRFWHKVLFDRGHVPVKEPFQRLVNQGMILGVSYLAQLLNGTCVSEDRRDIREKGYSQVRVERGHVEERDSRMFISQEFELGFNEPHLDGPYVALVNETDGFLVSKTELDVQEEGYAKVYVQKEYVRLHEGRAFFNGSFELSVEIEKMAKSRRNVINPDEVVDEYSADALRLYEMFMGPLEAVKPWNMRGVEGVFRFLNRVWRVIIDDRAEEVTLNDTVKDVPPEPETLRQLHRTIKRVTDDLDTMSFNTAIAAMMEYTNHLTKLPVRPRAALEPFVLLLAPFAPHIAEELWHALGHEDTLAYEPWPQFDPALLVEATVEIPVQIGGKVRARLQMPSGLDPAALEKAVLAHPDVKALLEGKTIQKVIVPSRGGIVNIVAR